MAEVWIPGIVMTLICLCLYPLAKATEPKPKAPPHQLEPLLYELRKLSDLARQALEPKPKESRRDELPGMRKARPAKPPKRR